MKINTYKEMNEKIVEFLRMGGTPIDLYAATRIEELEEQLKQAVGVLERIANQPTQQRNYGIALDRCIELAKDGLSSLSQETEVKP